MTEQSNQAKKRSSTGLIILIIILALISAGLVVWLLMTNSDLKELQDEKQQMKIELTTELDSLLAEHNRTKEEYGVLADSLKTKDSVIIANAKEIKSLLNYKWEYYKIKKKLSNLQEVAQSYVRQMDSLYRENQTLKDENIKIKQEYQQEIAKTRELTQIKDELTEQVDKASVLKAYNVSADPIQLKYGGKKEKVTDKAKRMDEIKICFTLSENKIVPKGEKKLYIRIAKPDKMILTPSRGDDYSFMYKGEKLQYSIMHEVDYQGSAADICLYWRKRSASQEMLEGTYHVEIFDDQSMLGATSFSVR
jgi:hypothetical protein